MPWNLRWHDPTESIIIFEPVTPWTWQEYLETVHEAQALIEARPITVHTIYHLTVDLNLPSPTVLTHLRQAFDTDPANSGLIVVVGASRLIERFVGILTRVVSGPNKIFFADTLDDAVALIGTARIPSRS